MLTPFLERDSNLFQVSANKEDAFDELEDPNKVLMMKICRKK